MIVKWGTYSHDLNECDVSITRSPKISEAGDRVGYVERWSITGMLIGTGIDDLTTKINLLVTAYSANAKDLKLLKDDAATVTSHQMLTASTIGGTKVVSGPTFQESEGEYVTWRRYSIEIEGYFEDGTSNTLAFNESVSLEGGLPRVAFIETLTGPPIAQTVAQKTTFRGSQSGTHVGRTSFPTAPSPLWPSSPPLMTKRVSKSGPKRIGPTGAPNLTEYSVSWDYQYESATPLTGNPNVG